MSQRVKTSFIGKYQLSWLLLQTIFVVIILEVALAVPTSASPLAVGGTGPGGVGVTTGGDTLELWLQSDKLVYSDSGCTTPQTTDGGMVGCWRDYSGNTNHVVQPTAANRPTFQNGSGDTLNAHPMLRWDGNDILVTTNNVPLGPLTVFVVYNATAEGYLYVHSPNVNFNNGSYIYTEDTSSYSVRRSSNEDHERLSPSWGISSISRIITHQYNGTSASHGLYINGLLQTPVVTFTTDAGIVEANTTFSIGGRSADTALRITGNFAEVIAYNDFLNSAQRRIVENYLQAKYNDSLSNNIVLGPSGTFDRYDGDTAANGNFDMDVAGIGQEADGSHAEAHSAGIIVEDIDFLQDHGDYILFGHRNITNTNMIENLPAGWGTDARRWMRHWYFDVTDVGNNGGTVNIIFDFSEGGMGGGSNPIGPASNYRLLGRSGFGPLDDFTVVFTATSVISDRVIFSGVPVTVLGSNFTLGSLDAVASPTAVEMQNAAALPLSLPPVIAGLAVLMLGGVTLVLLRRGRNA